MYKRAVIKISGIVQGVGFRPFVYRLAKRYKANGFVQNRSDCVLIDIDIEKESLDQFILDIGRLKPPLSRVDTIDTKVGQNLNRTEFVIIQSNENNLKTVFVSPDIALCDACLKEMRDSENRRYGYFFTNCTDCGPRYTIIKTLPYDRPNTSMMPFKMCNECRYEYENPRDRRYHAQPISCFDCGPKLFLKNAEGTILGKGADAIKLIADKIREGHIVAIKGLGGFHLVCDATNTRAVNRLRKRKGRRLKPLAVMCKDLKTVREIAKLASFEEKLINSRERPIVLVKKNSSERISDAVSPGIDRLGLFLPYTPIHYLIFDFLDCPIVATSANISEEPIIHKGKTLFEKFGHIFEYCLDYNREIVNACDDSVVQAIGKRRVTIRLSRGYAPKSFSLPFTIRKKILAVGVNQKSTISLAFGNKMILSPHIGDLNSIEAFDYFRRTVETFKRFYDFVPNIVVCDKHPEYETTKWALKLGKESGKPVYQVQHHYAHLLACMAEYQLDERLLGFAWDGTGYGDDGTIWGGEMMIADCRGFSRAGYFYPIRLIGGRIAILEPRRVALSVIFTRYRKLSTILSLNLPTLEAFSRKKIIDLYNIWRKGINSPYTSSVGRIFDAVASLAGITQTTSYEGESGLRMEAFFDPSIKKRFRYEISNGVVSLLPMIDQIADLYCDTHDKEVLKRMISSMFINTLVDIILSFCTKIPYSVILSGGVFQNRTLLESIIPMLKNINRKYYVQEYTPINDGGISLGQVWFASQIFKEVA